jgi:hypothetical protein
MNKRGVEMTMSTIIIAVMVILVLIIMVLIFNKSARNFFLGTSGCTSKGAECQQSPCPSGSSNMFAGNPECESKGEGMICCSRDNSLLGMDDGE